MPLLPPHVEEPAPVPSPLPPPHAPPSVPPPAHPRIPTPFTWPPEQEPGAAGMPVPPEAAFDPCNVLRLISSHVTVRTSFKLGTDIIACALLVISFVVGALSSFAFQAFCPKGKTRREEGDDEPCSARVSDDGDCPSPPPRFATQTSDDGSLREAARLRACSPPSGAYAPLQADDQGVCTAVSPTTLRYAGWTVPPRETLAPVEQHFADGQVSLSGPTAEGGWQHLIYLPSCEALRYDATHTGGAMAVKLQCRGVQKSSWQALTRSETMRAWQIAVSRLLQQARAEQRVIELP